MATIQFESTLFDLDSQTLLRLPESASAQLPSRGMTMVVGTINGFPLQAALEPDGEGSHWFKIDDVTHEVTGAEAGDTVQLAIEPTKEWREPRVPEDLQKVLEADPEVHALWMDVTTMARWDWIRWIGAAKQQETRSRRIEVTFSKLKDGKRRPCCFNRSECTLTDA